MGSAIIIRHAERHPLISVVDSLGVGLTDIGLRDAYIFGLSLPHYPRVRIWHSPSLRCHQTAENIALGLNEQGSEVVLFDEDWSLCGPYVRETESLLLAERMGNRFLREWFDGRVDTKLIDPVSEAVPQVLCPIIRKLKDTPGLDIHVSHDWDIMLLRESLFDIRFEEEGWLGFLDGLVFTDEKIRISAHYGDRSTLVDHNYQ